MVEETTEKKQQKKGNLMKNYKRNFPCERDRYN
jgi:hypothetical protein